MPRRIDRTMAAMIEESEKNPHAISFRKEGDQYKMVLDLSSDEEAAVHFAMDLMEGIGQAMEIHLKKNYSEAELQVMCAVVDAEDELAEVSNVRH